MAELTAQERFKRGAADAGRFFDYIAEFVGFTDEDAAAIHASRFIIEKHIPAIVAGFYHQLLRFPATRGFFLHKDGTVDREYLELRMFHQAAFWRRAAQGSYGEDFARFVDYVGRAHTSHGADPKLYIHERYVIGMVGYIQQRISDALADELGEYDPELARRASKAWNTLLIVILELLARAYRNEPERVAFGPPEDVDGEAMLKLSVETYERALRMAREIEIREFFVAPAAEIPDGSRKIIIADELSIGIFHHKGNWYALHNSCLHRGGPVCEGTLEGDVLTCPWHGYQYDVTTGVLLLDGETRLPGYEVEVRDGDVYVRLACLVRDPITIEFESFAPPGSAGAPPVALAAGEFLTAALKPGMITRVMVDSAPVAVANVDGDYFAVLDECTHMGGPLHQGHLEGMDIICPWHDSCFDLRSGQATCGPATEPVRTYAVSIQGEKGVVRAAN